MIFPRTALHRSEKGVNPTMSAKKTVTCLRSASMPKLRPPQWPWRLPRRSRDEGALSLARNELTERAVLHDGFNTPGAPGRVPR
jgi:hypothetical protein